MATGAATPEVEDVTPHAGSPNPARDRGVCFTLCNEPEAADFAAASDDILRRHAAATDNYLWELLPFRKLPADSVLLCFLADRPILALALYHNYGLLLHTSLLLQPRHSGPSAVRQFLHLVVLRSTAMILAHRRKTF